jgi:GxxExxY protein
MSENETGTAIVTAAIKVHSALGPGLLESAYARCLCYELSNRAVAVEREVPISLRYETLDVQNGYRVDMIVNGLVLVELKSIETVLPIHKMQLLSYLRLGRFKLGYLLNFNVAHMRDGVVRLVNGL